MNSKKLLYIGVTAVLVLSVLAIFTAGASAEDYTFITKWGSEGSSDGEFYAPSGIAVDSSGYVFVAEAGNSRIQKFDSDGTFITKWGSSGSGDGEFECPRGIAVDSSGYVYVADSVNHRIQKFDSVGNFITKWGCEGPGDGEFSYPYGITVDSSGYVFVADTYNNRIQKFDSVGNFITKWGCEGPGDGEFYNPRGIAVDSSGYVYVADSGNHRIQKFDSVGNSITKWGKEGTGEGEFRWPHGIAVDSSGYVFVADTFNHRIQKFDSVGTFITKWGSSGTGDGEFSFPYDIEVDSSGYVFVADTNNNRIQKFAPGIPEEPLLSFTPSSHDFGDKCEGDTDSTTFELWNSGAGTLTYSLSESCGWVEVNPTSGSSTGEHDTITVDIDTTGLSEGLHTCDISVSSNDGSGTFTVTVNIIGELWTFITTDKYEYHPGDTMTITVDIENPTASSVDTYFVLLLILPEYSYYQPMLVTRLTLPPYFDQTYNNDLYVGNWATIEFNAEWYVALLETSAPYDIICDDTAEWRYDHPVITRDKGTSKGGSAPSEEVVPEQIADAIMKSIGEIALPVEQVQEEEITEEISDAILD